MWNMNVFNCQGFMKSIWPFLAFHGLLLRFVCLLQRFLAFYIVFVAYCGLWRPFTAFCSLVRSFAAFYRLPRPFTAFKLVNIRYNMPI